MASVDYDPVKAHEYYEKHKKLKGRSRSRKGWDDTQKEQYEYAKAQAKDAYSKSADLISLQRSTHLQAVESAKKKQKEQITKQTSAAISQLRDKMKNMSPEQKEAFKEKLGTAIEKLKGKAERAKAKIDTSSAKQKESIKKDASKDLKSAKKDYEKTVDEAYDKINAMTKPKEKGKK